MSDSKAVKFMNICGKKIRVAHWQGSDRSALPLLYFNGIGASLETAEPLKALDRDVITFDVPGIGHSEKPTLPYRPLHISRIGREIVTKLGFDRVDVMGISWGGLMAQQYAFQYGKSVGKLVLAATSNGWLSVPGSLSALTKLISPMRYADAGYLMKNYTELYGDPVTPEAFAHAKRAIPPSRKGYLFQQMAIAGWSSVTFLPFIKAETLIMMGANDQLIPPANGSIMATLIPKAQLEIIPDSGHLFLLSKQEQTLSLLNEFLEAPSAGKHATEIGGTPAVA